MQQLFDDAAEKFEWVIADSPPTGVAADAGLLSSMVDGTILVILAGGTPYAAVQQAIESVGRERILGVVLNAVREDATPVHEYYGVPQGGRS
jgi:Mrp family chromosome partitioning ATPase